MSDIHDGKLNGLAPSFHKELSDHRLVVIRLPIYLIRSIGLRARVDKMSVQTWIKDALERELEMAADVDWLNIDIDRPQIEEDEI